MLPVGVLGPSGHHRLVRERISMLEVAQPRNQTRRSGGAAGVGGEEPRPFPFENTPVNQGLELHQLMAHVDHLDQSRAQQVVLFRRWLSGLHIMARNCKVPTATIRNLATHAQQNNYFLNVNQMSRRCSGRTTEGRKQDHPQPPFPRNRITKQTERLRPLKTQRANRHDQSNALPKNRVVTQRFFIAQPKTIKSIGSRKRAYVGQS